MANFRQGIYEVRNPAKYVGVGKPRYRSGWEMTFMMFLDSNEHVLQWASESISIPYRNPITGKQSMYVPDFLITYRNRNNTTNAEIVEIKPKKQSLIESKASARDRAIVAVNYAKWDAATKWARRNGLTFRVITEDDIFRNGRK
jgi:TnsA endonuclease N terminal